MERVRRVLPEELDSVMGIYDRARTFMAANGNPRQWKDHPSRELIQRFIDSGYEMCIEDEDGPLLGVFALMPGPEESYRNLESGQWLDEEPYWVIHAVASTFRKKGFFSRVCTWVFGQVNNVRIDTSPDNAPMLKSFHKAGFSRCGTFHPVESPELELVAFQRHDRKD